jgi:hypothetical protein
VSFHLPQVQFDQLPRLSVLPEPLNRFERFSLLGLYSDLSTRLSCEVDTPKTELRGLS